MHFNNDNSPFNISINAVKFIDNRVLQKNKAAIIDIRYGNKVPVLHDLLFTKNMGTPLVLTNVILNVTGDITFDGNNAITGGGLYIDRSVVSLADNATMHFVNNYAIYGGAVYIEATQEICFITSKYKQPINIEIQQLLGHQYSMLVKIATICTDVNMTIS